MRHPESGVAAERLPELRAVHPRRDAASRAIEPPPSRAARAWTRDEAIVELLRGRLAIARPDHRAAARRDAGASTSPTPTRRCWRSKREGVVLRGSVRAQPRAAAGARVVRPPAARADPSLHAEPAARRNRAGQPGRLHAVPVRVAARRAVQPADRRRRPARRLEPLDGFELAADAWERAVLPGARRRLRARRCSTRCA